MAPEAELIAGISQLIRRTLNIDVPTDDTDLLETGLLDSLALVTLIVELEEHFACQLPLDDFDLENFRTVERIAGFLAPMALDPRRAM